MTHDGTSHPNRCGDTLEDYARAAGSPTLPLRSNDGITKRTRLKQPIQLANASTLDGSFFGASCEGQVRALRGATLSLEH